MIDNIIDLICPDCKKKIKLKVKSITKLQEENKSLRAKITHLENMEKIRKSSNNNGFNGFMDMFGG